MLINNNEQVAFSGLILKDIVSCEYLLENDIKKHILDGVSIVINKNEILGLCAKSRLELLIIIEILGNMRPFYKGMAKLSKLGVSRKKRSITDEIFYIDTPYMLYGDMVVLQHVMFATKYSDIKVLDRQKSIMDLMINLGLKKIMLQNIADLSYNFRLIVTILIAVLSKSEILVVNLIDNKLEEEEIILFKNIIEYSKSLKKGIVCATMQPTLIGMAFDNVSYIINGRIVNHESVKELCLRYDKVICIIKGRDYQLMKEVLLNNLKDIDCSINDNYLIVSYTTLNKIKISVICDVLDKFNINYDFIKVNKGRVLNSFEELIKNYDLQ